MLKVGSHILTAWFALNILPGLGSVVFILMGKHAPGLQFLFSADEVGRLDSRVLATTDGIALMLNTLIVSYCILGLIVVRRALLPGARWSWWALLLGIVPLQASGYAANVLMGGKNMIVLHISTLVLAAGFGLSARGLYASSSADT